MTIDKLATDYITACKNDYLNQTKGKMKEPIEITLTGSHPLLKSAVVVFVCVWGVRCLCALLWKGIDSTALAACRGEIE